MRAESYQSPSSQVSVSIMPSVGTKTSKRRLDATIEIRIESSLKRAVQAKAREENRTLSAVVSEQLTDFVSGPITGPGSRSGAPKARRDTVAQLRSKIAQSTNLLIDIHNMVSRNSAVTNEAITQLLNENLEINQEILNFFIRCVR